MVSTRSRNAHNRGICGSKTVIGRPCSTLLYADAYAPIDILRSIPGYSLFGFPQVRGVSALNISVKTAYAPWIVQNLNARLEKSQNSADSVNGVFYRRKGNT